VDERVGTIRISVVSNICLTAFKIAAGVAMGSLGVIAEGLHSGLDLLASLVTFFSLREAVKPADEVHLYGHGKFENLAGLVETALILVAAASLVYGAVGRLLHAGAVQGLGWGAGVMAGSMLVNWYVSGRLLAAGRALDSPALTADGRHLRTDVYTSAGVLVGLLLIRLTGNTAFDSVTALAVALLILKTAYDLGREALTGFLDVRLPPAEERAIRDVLAAHAGHFVNYHALRMRHSGSRHLVDLHLMVPEDHSIGEVHDLCDHLEEELVSRLPGCETLIHIEPCKRDCPHCQRKEQGLVKVEFGCRSSGCRFCGKRD